MKLMLTAFPKEIAQDQDTFTIMWNDGHVSSYPCSYLRSKCPCALCAEESGRTRRTSTEKAPVMIMKADPIGRYALSFQFTDMNQTGIYAFGFLRSICPCNECQEKK